MAKQTFLIFLLIATSTACTKAELASVPTEAATPAAMATATQEPLATPAPLPNHTATATNTPAPTNTATATLTPIPTVTPPFTQLEPFSQTEDMGEVELEIVNQIGGAVMAVDVQDNLAYLGIGSRLAVADISDQTQPKVIFWSSILPDVATQITLRDGLAYVAIMTPKNWTTC